MLFVFMYVLHLQCAMYQDSILVVGHIVHLLTLFADITLLRTLCPHKVSIEIIFIEHSLNSRMHIFN